MKKSEIIHKFIEELKSYKAYILNYVAINGVKKNKDK